MTKKSKASILLIVMLAGVIALTSGCTTVKSSETEVTEEEKYTPVAVEKASKDSIENEISISGKTFANNEVAVMPKVMGTVTNVNVALGDVVQKGSPLFSVEQDNILKSVEAASSSVDLAEKGVAQAENGLKTAKLNYETNKDQIENAMLTLERTRKLYEEGAVSKSQLEQAELAASENNLKAVEAQVKQAEISYEQALDQLRQAEISYEQVKDNLDDTTVTAPITGIISTLDVKEGKMATNTQPAAMMVEMDKVYLQVNVVENLVNQLSEGQEVKVSIPAAFDEEMTSTISYVSPTVNPATGLYTVRVYVENSEKNIRPGMNGEIKVGLDTVESAVIVPGSAVLDKEDRKVVYVVEDGKAFEKEVTTGLDIGDYVEIKEGLNEEEEVIVEGQHYVEDGAKVKVVRGE